MVKPRSPKSNIESSNLSRYVCYYIIMLFINMSKKYISKLKFHIEAGNYLPNAILNASLSPYNINITECLKIINSKSNLYKGNLIKIKIYIIEKNKYNIKIGSPITSILLKSINTKNKISELNKIIKLKKLDFPRKTKLEIFNILKGTAKTINIINN